MRRRRGISRRDSAIVADKVKVFKEENYLANWNKVRDFLVCLITTLFRFALGNWLVLEMAEAILVNGISEISKKIGSLAGREVSLMWGVKGELKKLQKNAYGLKLQEAVDWVVKNRLDGQAGMIAVSSEGEVAYGFNNNAMFIGCATEDEFIEVGIWE
ncbi:hypothetical protein Sjap_021299 [Stephania japonica]|uniref:Uncharacterized protein n=1 Tax=Stephania japonica TaxID=461633 RepID=A0AAP0HSQ8_9MAGN